MTSQWLTLSRKIIILAATLMLSMITIGYVGYLNSSKLGRELHASSEIVVPSLRYATLVDMMHDGLRSVVYQSFFVAAAEDENAKKEVLGELDEFLKNMKDYNEKLGTLDNSPEISAALKAAEPDLKNYLIAAESIVKTTLVEKNVAKAKEQLPSFNEVFSKLENSLGQLGELIEKNAQDSQKEAYEAEKKANLYSSAAISIGVLLGLMVSFLVTKSSVSVLKQVIKDLNSESDSIQESSSSMAATAKTLTDSIDHQASSLQQTASAIEEISSMVAKTSENAEQSIRLAASNQQSATNGTAEMDRLVRQVSEIERGNQTLLSTVDENNKKFVDMVQIITNISEKTKVINDIVFQTKLLAFNASVEAARAGEHGKGFAVVAQEVSNLASMSGNAAREIGEMVGDSVSRVESIIESSKKQLEVIVQSARTNVQNCMGAAEKCQQVLDESVKNSGSVSQSVNEITQATREQSQGVQDVSAAIREIDTATQFANKAAKEVKSTSDELGNRSLGLQSAVKTLERLVG